MILAIIQARMSSTRLPGKVLKDLAGRPMLQWVIDAAVDSKLIDHVIVATSDDESDDPICEYLKEGYFRGSLYDVLDRFYQAAIISSIHPTHIVRLTADCPLLISEVIDEVIKVYLDRNLDYIINDIDGLDVEVFPYVELLRAHKLATSDYEREHVTPFIDQYSGAFGQQVVISNDRCEPFSVNTQEEFDLMEGILSGLQSYVVQTRNGGRGLMREEFDAIRLFGYEVTKSDDRVCAPVGNYYGGPSVWERENKYYLSVGDYDGHPTIEISKDFYDAFLMEFDGGE